MFKFKLDKVSIVSCIISLTAFIFVDVLSIKKSRISESIVGINFLQLPYVSVIVIISAILILIFLFAFVNDFKFRYISGMLSGALIIIITIIAGTVAEKITVSSMLYEYSDVELEALYMRVALDTGYWLMLLGLFINIINTMKYLKNKLLLKLIFVITIVGGLVIVVLSGITDYLSIMREFHSKRDIFFNEFLNHITISMITISISSLIGFLLGVLVYKYDTVKKISFPILNISQTIPSIALFGIMVSLLPLLSLPGIGKLPAIIALVIYALLPITRNTYTALISVDRDIIEAGKSMGMSNFQLMYKVLFPLSVPIILNGIRIALIQVIGLTSIVTLIGAGGLGKFIFNGADSTAYDLILLGAIPVIIIAVICDFLMQFLIQITKPKGF